ncbi:MAG: prepilin-type N-terminal cleavage/methylation domain-containing protein [Candidatus Omnitrophota bacterium]
MIKKNKSVTLVELLISVTVVSIMVLSFYSLDTFSRTQVLNSDRRAKLQNELSLALEHMSKYVQQATGNNLAAGNQAIRAVAGGFQVRVDLNNPQNPFSLTDDAWVTYTLAGNTLSTQCAPAARCGSFSNATLSLKVITFNPQIANNGTSVLINLIGRHTPGQAASLRNPQVEVRTRLVCGNCSIN